MPAINSEPPDITRELVLDILALQLGEEKEFEFKDCIVVVRKVGEITTQDKTE